MILSDVTIREELAAGRIVIDPLRDGSVQPSSVDLHCDRFFRVFRNDTTPFIDPKLPQEDLTELVEVPDGRAFILHPGEFVLGSTLERVALPDDLVARLEGKALALDTEVPTPFGWTTMGALAPGDVVFDERGEPTRVVAATRTFYDRPCREVVFSDGATVVADLAHLWSTVDKNGRRYGRRVANVRSTEVIEHTLRVRGERNHQIELAAPVAYPERALPIDPYLLGIGSGGGDEHVPADYLRASVAQRTALLQGLMDGAGHVDELGRCDFTTIDHRLAEQVAELVASLGFRATLAKRRATANGVEGGPRYQVRFTPDRPVFRLPRKLARQRTAGRFHRFRAIVDVRVVPPVPVRCIQVASPSGQFLVTRSYIPTHNSSLGRLGLLIHSTAGFVDSGWDGHLTLELSNVANLPIAIYPGMKIGQISFLRMTTAAEHPYGSKVAGSKYQGQRGPTPSRYYLNFRDEPPETS